MNYRIDQEYHGFRVVRIRDSRELNGQAVEMEHMKTGARLFWLNNGCENKVFSIAFRTLPDDDSGVFHILEHTVLCGSEKYPVREPFVELLKNSMNTFLNAMTFQDMTMYPVGSRNDRDLLNLTEVYLDAVFTPRSMEDERIFCQEGWHIEKDPEKNQYIYKGVVLNEMKGAMSDADSIGEQEMARMLYPDNGYGYNSGGEPESIPDLSYDKYREQYRTHYHPGNAWIYLDGAVPMDEMLPLINGYLNRYERNDIKPVFKAQKPVSSEKTVCYELGQEESAENRGQLYLGRIDAGWQDRTRNAALALISDVLCGTNEAPLKRLILEKGLAQDISLNVDSTTFQSALCIRADNVTDGREDELRETIRAFGKEAARTGLNQDAAEASLNRMIFSIREEEEPQGIGRAVRVMNSWLYDGDPLFYLENENIVNELRRMLDTREINRLIPAFFREDEGLCVLHLIPSKTLGDERRRRESERLEKITSAWTEEEKEKNEALISSLQRWQDTPDSEEALSTLPMLTKEDADISPEWARTETTVSDGVKILRHPEPCSGITHLRMYFRLTDMTLEELVKVNMISNLMCRLGTENYDALFLQQEIKKYIGRISTSVICLDHPDDKNLCTPYFCVSVSVLDEYLAKAQDLIAEILLKTNFTQKDRITEIARQIDLAARQKVVGSGHVIAVRNVLSHYSAEYAVRNALEGDEAIRYIHEFAAHPDKSCTELQETAEKLITGSFCRSRVIFSVTSDRNNDLSRLIRMLPEGKDIPFYASYHCDSPLEAGYRIPAQIGFSARGYRLSEMGESFNGVLLLVSNILSLSYLWNRVRVQGGAYGTGFTADRMGNLFTYSFRDPTPDKSLMADAGASGFLRELVDGPEGLDKFIISTLNDLNPLISPRDKGAAADIRFLTGYTKEMGDHIRKQILYATREDILSCCKILDEFAKNGATCVVAHEEALKKCGNIAIQDL